MPLTPPLLVRGLALLASFALLLTTQAADPGVGEWTTFGNGPSHSGFYPKTIGSASFTPGWNKTFSVPINPVAVSGDTIYATTNGYFTGGMRAFAMNVTNGTEKWSFPLADAFSVNPPTYANGRVYFQRGNHGSDTHLWCLDAASGALRFAAPHAAQWERYAAPTVADGGAFVNGGYYGGMYGFDATTGTQRFFISNLAQEDGWTPSYVSGVVYACVNGIFTAYNPQTGAQLWTRDLKTTSTGTSTYWNDGNIPVISEGKASIVGGGRLLVIDLATRAQLWSLAGAFYGTPAFAEGVVYAYIGTGITAYNATNGAVLGTYATAGTAQLVNQPLVTKDLVLAATETNTFVFNRSSFARREVLSGGGSLSYAAGRLYAVATPWNSPTNLATFTVTPVESDPPTGPLDPPIPPQPRPNPDRPLGTTTVAWLDAMKVGGIHYFLFDNPAKIERYNLATGAWLAPISLPSGPKGFTVSSAAIYVSFGTGISKFPLDGTTETPLATTAMNIKSLFEINGRLYVANESGSGFLCIDPTYGSSLGAKNFNYSIGGMSVATTKSKILGRSTGVSPSDILSISINSDGSFGTQVDSPYHGDYPNAARTFLFPGDGRVVDDSGLIYSTSDLSYLGSLAGAFNDIDFGGDSTVVLRQNNTLVGYSASLAETGRKTIASTQLRISIAGDFVHSFARQDGRGVVATKTALSEIVPADPGTGIDPTNLTYSPDAIEFGTDTVFLLSKLHQSVFRWSISQQRYLASIPLTEVPQHMAYSAALHRLYLSYSTGRLTKIDLSSGLAEQAFANLPQGALGLQTAGEHLFACDPSGAWATHYTFSPDGVMISAVDWNYFSQGYTWSAVNRRMYFLRDDTSPNDLHWENIDLEGKIGLEGESPYHGDFEVRHPIRVAPNGSTVVLGNGDVYNALSLQRLGKLSIAQPPPASWPNYTSNPAVVDAAWLNGTLHTIRGTYSFGNTTADGGMIESWNATFAATDSGAARGTPLRLNALSDGLLLVALLEGRPVFSRFNPSLDQVASEPGNNPPVGSPITRANPVRPLGPTTGPWLDSVKHNGISYFLFASPAKIERYEISTGNWLEPISLPDGPRFFAVTSGGIYVSFGKAISRFSLDGTTETLLISTSVDVRPLAEHNGLVYVAATASSRFGAASAQTGLMVNEVESSYTMNGVSFSAARGKFFGRTSNVSPSDVVMLSLKTDGTYGAQSDSPYHGEYPNATRTILFPGDARVVDDAGIIYSTGDLSYLGSLAGAFDDVDFNGDAPILLRANKTLVGYSAGLLETGRKTIAVNQLRIAVGGGFVHSFARQDGRGVVATKTALGDIGPTDPGPGIDPTSLTYTPDAIDFGNDTVFLLSKLHQSVFRWSISQNRYLATIPLVEIPQHMAYSSALNRLYLSYNGGRVTKVDLATGTQEVGFVNLPLSALGIQTAGEYFFACDGSGAWATHYTFSPSGVQISAVDWNYFSRGYTWSASNRRMYFLRDDTSPNDLHWEEINTAGAIGSEGESPYHGEHPVRHPIRVAPNGSTVVLGNGDVYNGPSLQYLGKLAIAQPPTSSPTYSTDPAVVDAAWLNGTLHTVRGTYLFGSGTASDGMIESWNTSFASTGSGASRGTPLRLNVLADGLLLVSLLDGRPVFAKYNSALTQVSSEPGNNPPAGGVITHANPDRPLGPTSGPWIDSARHNGIAYFLFDVPAKVERYNLATGGWLAPISLPAGPKSLATGVSGIYVSFGKTLSRFSLDGATETILLSAASELRPVTEHNGRIYITVSSASWGNFRMGAVNVNTGAVESEALYSYPLTGVSFAPQIGKFFGRSTGVSPSDIIQVTLTASGALGTQTDSPHHGSYPSATRTFVFPGEGRVLDNAGSVYSSSNLQYAGSLSGAFTDADFAGDRPIVLRNGALVVYSSALLELGRKTLTTSPLRLYATNDTIISFGAAADRGVVATSTLVSSITSPQPPDPVDPTDLDYTPDSLELGSDGIVYILSKQHLSVFRWSIAQQQYLETIPLAAAPETMAYSASLNRLYLATAAGVISKIDLSVEREERPFATLTSGPLRGLQTAGDFLVAGLKSGTDYYRTTFASDANPLSVLQSAYNSSVEFTWSPANRRMYFVSDNILPNDVRWEAIDSNGLFGSQGDSPYDGIWPVIPPVRVAPNGSILVVGNGDVYDALSLNRLGSLLLPVQTTGTQIFTPAAVTDAAWHHDRLFTVRTDSFNDGLIHRWNATRQLSATASLPGSALRLFALTNDLLAITMKNQRPVFTILDPDLGSPEPDPIDFTEFAGTFMASLSGEAGVGEPIGGMVKLTLGAGGSASGVIKVAGKAIPFEVAFDQYGHATLQLNLKGVPCTLTLSLEMGSSGPRLVGSVESDSWTLAINGARAMDSGDAKRHLFTLSGFDRDAPPVCGRGRLNITRNGHVRIKASLLMGGGVSQGSMLLEDGSIVVNLVTPLKTNFINGRITINDQSEFDWMGTLRYFKKARPGAVWYPNEIDAIVFFRGSRYRPSQPPLPINKNGIVTVILSSGDLEEPLAIEGVLDPSGLILSTADYRLDYAIINSSTGIVRGFFMHPKTEAMVSFSGVVLQEYGQVHGAFLGPKHGGQVVIAPGRLSAESLD